MSERTVVQHAVVGEVTLSPSPRARRVSISVRVSGEVRLTFPHRLSAKRALAFLDAKSDWILAARERMARRCAALPPALPPEEERSRIEALRRAAKEDLPPRIARLSEATGLRYAKLSIRASRTKWGSCSGANHISLSLFLMTLPEPLRDFVILHELCHTAHHNHSPRFHALLDRLTGGREKALNRELRAYSIR
ncbi:MAG TPA: M48 family metallopeptidase [Candidatus Alistipes intestinipullorum]|nr:M48 family metallopeptidase [Candidatus Alistipes intestinipullorum]